MSLATEPGVGAVHAAIAKRLEREDEARSRWLDEQIREARMAAKIAPQCRPRKRAVHKARGRRKGQTHCACGRPLAKWNKSGACTPCQWQGAGRKTT